MIEEKQYGDDKDDDTDDYDDGVLNNEVTHDEKDADGNNG